MRITTTTKKKKSGIAGVYWEHICIHLESPRVSETQTQPPQLSRLWGELNL